MNIDWNDEKSPISKHFTVREALWLPSWNRLAGAADGLDSRICGEIVRLAQILDLVREKIGAPFFVHSWYRPPAYNALIAGSPQSAHMSIGAWSACDFHVQGHSDNDGCALMRDAIRPNLSALSLRMENLAGPWVHLDDRQPFNGQPRFFKP